MNTCSQKAFIFLTEKRFLNLMPHLNFFFLNCEALILKLHFKKYKGKNFKFRKLFQRLN